MKTIVHKNEARNFTVFMLVADALFLSILFLTHMQ